MPNLFDALSQAYRKMKVMLFSPFSLLLWATLAFPAFLAELGSGGGFAFNFIQPSAGKTDFAARFPDQIPVLFAVMVPVIIVCAIFVVGMTLLLYWLSSRGRFMFLDMLIRGVEADRISARWSRFKRPANSFYKIKLCFFLLYTVCAVVGILTMLPLLVPMINSLAQKDVIQAAWLNYDAVSQDMRSLYLGIMIFFPTVCFLATLFTSIVEVLFNDYGALLMYCEGISGGNALMRVLYTIKEQPLLCIKYICGVILIYLMASVAILAFLIVTCCCIGYLLLAIPFISTVVRMPIIYTRWQFILEYFGRSEFIHLPEEQEPPAEEGLDSLIIKPDRQDPVI